MKARLLLLGAIVSLTGCAIRSNGPLEWTDSDYDYNFSMVGIPYLLGGFGTAVPIDENLSITAKHVAKYSFDSVVAYHEHCDIAIVERDNSDLSIPKWGSASFGDNIQNVGWGLTFQEVSGYGEYRTNVNLTNEEYKNCFIAVTDAPLQTGMSGGGAYNEKGELIGVNFMIADELFDENGEPYQYERYSFFVSMEQIKDWVNAEVKSYNQKND